MAYDEALAERVRQLLAERDDVVEKRMVGGLSFVVGGSLCCGVNNMGLVVRVGADGRAQALAQPHVQPLMMGKKVVAGFVCVAPAGCRGAGLRRWVKTGLAVVATLAPPDRAARKRSRRRT
jgi:TfoX/Sxy family transcriptional regulator of competence genes